MSTPSRANSARRACSVHKFYFSFNPIDTLRYIPMGSNDQAKHHPMFFYNDGTHIFRYLFKVHESILSEKPETFNDTFPINGHSEITPIVLPVTISETAFELFLCVRYHKWQPDSIADVPNDVVFQLLELGRMFMSTDARQVAINEVNNRRMSIRPCRLISLSVEYALQDLFKYAFGRLVKARLDDLADDEYTTMCPQLWAAVLKAQSILRTHRRIVACEPPPIEHAAGCPDPENCAADWHQLWWNGMGRFLLDGRNPQPYEDVLKRFEEILLTGGVGNISPACLHSVMVIDRGKSAFHQEDSFIDRVATKWADKLLK